MQALVVILVLIVGAVVAAFAAIFILIPICKGIGWCIRHLYRFVAGEISDVLRVVGAVITVPFLCLFTVASVVFGRWSAASHFGRSIKDETLTMGAAAYRVVIGHPARLLCLTALTDGLERRLPNAIAEAPGPDKPRGAKGQFEGYSIVGSLPGGGSGSKLYVAEPDDMKRAAFARRGLDRIDQVVIKSFSLSDGSSLPQIVRESRSLDAAKDLGLVLEHNLSPDRFYYVMEYVPGESLTHVAQRWHALSGDGGLRTADLRTALGYMSDLCRTLSGYHRGGLWHKDVKPDNVIVDGDRAHLVDLGLITHMRSAMTLTTHGTEYFRDPELVRMALKGVKVNEVEGARFDVYGVGAALYSVIENSFPAHGGLSQLARRCPEAARWIIRRAMTDYDKRYGSMQEMLADIETVRTAPDPFAVRPADLPSMRGGASPEMPSSDSPSDFDVVWTRIQEMAGATFHTKRGLEFTYRCDGSACYPDRTDWRIARSDFKKAFAQLPLDGPGGLENSVMGPSYVWAILHDPRIGAVAPERRGSQVADGGSTAPPQGPRPPREVFASLQHAVGAAAADISAHVRHRAEARQKAQPAPAKPRVRNWWTGAFDLEEAGGGGGAVQAVAYRGSPVPRKGRGLTPVESRPSAEEQLRRARARRDEIRRRAHDRMSRRAPTRAGRPGSPLRRERPARYDNNINGGVAVALFLFLAVCVGVAAMMLAPSVRRTTARASVVEAPRLPEPPAPASPPQPAYTFDDLSALVLRDPGAINAEVSKQLERLSTAGATVLGFGPDAEEHADTVAKLRASLGLTPFQSSDARQQIESWLGEHRDIDLVVWVSAGDDARPAAWIVGSPDDISRRVLQVMRGE